MTTEHGHQQVLAVANRVLADAWDVLRQARCDICDARTRRATFVA
jgi:hypothetical protein